MSEHILNNNNSNSINNIGPIEAESNVAEGSTMPPPDPPAYQEHQEEPHIEARPEDGGDDENDHEEQYGLDSMGNDELIRNIIAENDSKSPLHMAFMNMANSILGAGIISQPFAIKQTGVVGAFIVYILLGFIIDWTLRLIVQNLVISGTKTYQDSVEKAMGKKGKLLIMMANGLFAFGGCVGFCMIMGDSIPHVLRTIIPDNYIERNWVIICTTVFISLPLSLHRNIEALEKASGLALVSMAIIVLTVTIRGPFLSQSLKSQVTLFHPKWWFRTSIFKSISIISFALVCHHNTSFIYFSLKNKSIAKFTRLTHISCMLSVIICMTMGYFGFHVFKEKTKGNVLNNFPGDDNIINIARLFFGFNMLTTFPLEIFVLRNIVMDILNDTLLDTDYREINDMENGDINNTDNTTLQEANVTKYHTIVTILLVLSTMGISLTTCNLGALFELIGSTTASIIAFILPPLTNIILTNGTKHSIKERFSHYAVIIFGFMVMIISSSQTILGSINNHDVKHCEL